MCSFYVKLQSSLTKSRKQIHKFLHLITGADPGGSLGLDDPQETEML